MPYVEEKGVVAGNVENKYIATNPIYTRLLQNFLKKFDTLVEKTDAVSAIEVGCGEGYLCKRMAQRGMKVKGCDFSEQIINQAEELNSHPMISYFARSIYDMDSEQFTAPLVVCCEVLEHLEDTRLAMFKLRQLTEKWLILSVPREPLWRILNIMRGKYIENLGNTPGHIQHWTKNGFLELIQSYFQVVEVCSPIPWTMVLGKKRHP